MHDVARVAGVSQRTVSNVVNNYAHVSSRTRERVLHAIKTLEYRPNAAARSLRQGRSRVIALAIPDLTWPYFAEIAHLVRAEAERHNYSVAVIETHAGHGGEGVALSQYDARMAEGLILSTIEMDAKQLDELDIPLPTVLLGERIHDAERAHFSINNVEAAREMARHLLEQGARSFIVLGSTDTPVTQAAGGLRLRGFMEELAAWGLDESAILKCPASPWTLEEGYRAMRVVRRDALPDAVFAMNDLLAFGGIRALSDRGINVPGDILFTGWDDIGLARYAIPTITTVSPGKEAIVQGALCALLNLVEGREARLDDVIVEHRIVRRQSTSRTNEAS